SAAGVISRRRPITCCSVSGSRVIARTIPFLRSETGWPTERRIASAAWVFITSRNRSIFATFDIHQRAGRSNMVAIDDPDGIAGAQCEECGAGIEEVQGAEPVRRQLDQAHPLEEGPVDELDLELDPPGGRGAVGIVAGDLGRVLDVED